MSIRARLSVLLAGMSLSLILTAASAVVSLNDLNARMNEVYDRKLAAMELSQQLKTAMADLNQYLIVSSRQMKAGLTYFQDEIRQRKERVHTILGQIDAMASADPQTAEFVAQMKDGWQKFLSSSEELEDAIVSTDFNRFIARYQTALREINQVLVNADMLYKMKSEEVSASRNYIRQAKNRAVAASALVFLVAWAAIGAYGFLTYRNISRRLRKLVRVNAQIATGDLRVPPMKEGRDEIGTLAQSANRIVRNLTAMIADTQQSVLRMTASVEQVGRSIAEASTAARTIAGNVRDIAVGTAEQAKALEQSLEAVTRLEASVTNISEIVADLQKNTESLNETVNLGASELSATAAHIDTAVDAQRAVVEAFDRLGRELGQIKQFSERISRIAKNTNILAINASIEAARAGAHGREFAVLAAEIRQLSMETTQTAKDVTDLVVQNEQKIAEVRQHLSQTADSSRRSRQAFLSACDIFREISRMFRETNEKLSDVFGRIDDILRQSRSISGRLSEISSVSEQISAAMQEIDASVDRQAQHFREIAEAADVQTAQADLVRRCVAQFAVGDNI